MPIPGGWAREALLQEVMQAPLRALSPLADTRIVERPGWRQRITPSLRQGGGQRGLDRGSPRGRSRRGHRRDPLGIPIARAALPLARRAGIPRPPISRNVWRRADSFAMRRPASRAAFRPSRCVTPRPPGSRVSISRALTSPRTGWPPAGRGTSRRSARCTARCSSARQRATGSSWRARAPCRSGSRATASVDARRTRGAFVLPSHRGRGICRALVAIRIADAAARRVALATSHARPERSAPILARLGFETICRSPAMFSPERPAPERPASLLYRYRL